MFKFFLLFILLNLHALFASVILTENVKVYDNFDISYYIDQSGHQTIDDIVNLNFKDDLKNSFTFGYGDHPTWFKIDIENNSSKENFYLYFEHFNMREFTIYEAEESKWKTTELGWENFNKREEVLQSDPIYTMYIPPHTKKHYYIKLYTKIGLVGKFVIYDDIKRLFHDIASKLYLYLFVLGGIVMAIVINVYFFFTLKDKVHGYFATYLFIYMLFILFYDTLALDFGLTKYYVFSQMFTPLVISFLALFTREFLQVKQYYPKFYMLLNLVALLFAILAILVAFNINPWFELFGALAPFAFLILLYTAIKVGYSGHKKAKYYFILMIINFISLGYISFIYDGTLSYSDFGLYSFLYVAFFEAGAFSLLIADRVNEASKKIIEVQNELIEEKEFNEEELENRVNERTKELIQLKDEMKIQAERDALTGLYNRYYIDKISEEVFQKDLSILIMDVDHFKKVNDNYGHIAGDRVLKALANILISTLKKDAIAIRYGGEEFLILLPNTKADDAQIIAERMRKVVKQSSISIAENKNINITISIGVASFLDDSEGLDDLLNRADEKLYEAKKSGRNSVYM